MPGFWLMRFSPSSLLGLLLATAAVTQTPEPAPVLGKIVPAISLDTYHHIMDLVFAPAEKTGTPGVVVFSLALRVEPAFRPESQVTMMLFLDRTTRVEFAVTDQNIYYACNALFGTTGESSAESLAKKVVAKRYALNVPPSRLLEWQQGLFKSLGPTLVPLQKESDDKYQRRPGMLMLDGNTHDVRYTVFDRHSPYRAAVSDALGLGKVGRSRSLRSREYGAAVSNKRI
jgi:hypothetical protein